MEYYWIAMWNMEVMKILKLNPAVKMTFNAVCPHMYILTKVADGWLKIRTLNLEVALSCIVMWQNPEQASYEKFIVFVEQMLSLSSNISYSPELQWH